jgi:hypothetical protein
MLNAEYQILNIKYPTSKAALTGSSVFDVGYSVLDIQRESRRSVSIFKTGKGHDAEMQNIKHSISNIEHQRLS